MNHLRNTTVFLSVILFGFVLDIFSKCLVFDHFQAVVSPSGAQMKLPADYRPIYNYGNTYPNIWVPENYRPITVIPYLFTIRVVLNLGAVWGSFQGKTFLLTIVAILAVFFIFYLVWKNQYGQVYQILLGLIMAGALGNLWDRIWFGGVRDFLDVYSGEYHWPTFNLADCYIVVGILGYIGREWSKEKQPTAK